MFAVIKSYEMSKTNLGMINVITYDDVTHTLPLDVFLDEAPDLSPGNVMVLCVKDCPKPFKICTQYKMENRKHPESFASQFWPYNPIISCKYDSFVRVIKPTQCSPTAIAAANIIAANTKFDTYFGKIISADSIYKSSIGDGYIIKTNLRPNTKNSITPYDYIANDTVPIKDMHVYSCKENKYKCKHRKVVTVQERQWLENRQLADGTDPKRLDWFMEFMEYNKGYSFCTLDNRNCLCDGRRYIITEEELYR